MMDESYQRRRIIYCVRFVALIFILVGLLFIVYDSNAYKSLSLFVNTKLNHHENTIDDNIESPQILRGPLVINTWNMVGATDSAYRVLLTETPDNRASVHLDALEQGLHYCEEDYRCGQSVGEGGSPDEHGETTLDASIVDGNTLRTGSVGGLRRVSNAIGVARAIMEYTMHTTIAGDLATEFAVEMGFPLKDLHTNQSIARWQSWKNSSCQPNYRKNVTPNPSTSCGPYKPIPRNDIRSKILFKDDPRPVVDKNIHDTIGMVVLSASGSVGAGASTNGLTWKVPGRLGDVPIIGSGSYADSRFGGCAATGDGDILMRFLPCVLTLENLRNGMPLQVAADRALLRITEFYPTFTGALVVLKPNGEFTGSAYGWIAEMSVRNLTMTGTTVYRINPIGLEKNGSYKPSYLTKKPPTHWKLEGYSNK